uniref:Intraflagellar transport protein 20-like n=1 Tax=Elaeophora elaphi TaxID=1147741 RepID=A0A0R3S0E5_9BILA
MADEALMKAGLFVDAYNKIRLLQPDVADASNEIVEEVKELVNKLNTFSDATETIIKTFDVLAITVESEKIRAMSSRNALKTADKQHVADEQQLQILIREREVELERLHIELESIQRQEHALKEYLQKFISP